MPDIFETLKSRTSVAHYDPSFTLSKAGIEELISLAQEAPTSFNMQNWRVVAYDTPEAKKALRAVCFDQPKITDAAVAFVFIGQTDGYTHVAETFAPMVEKGLAGANVQQGMQKMATGLYEGHPDIQRDEAVRSCSFAAMALMLAAKGKGLASCPMIGIDIAGVSKLAGVKESETLGLVVVVGKAGEKNWPRKPRKALKDQLSFA